MLAENDKIKTEEKELVKIFYDYYIDIVKRSCRTKPTNFTILQKNTKSKTINSSRSNL